MFLPTSAYRQRPSERLGVFNGLFLKHGIWLLALSRVERSRERIEKQKAISNIESKLSGETLYTSGRGVLQVEKMILESKLKDEQAIMKGTANAWM